MAACANADDFECVGHNSWGFATAHIADYSPAAAALNSASCSFTMKPYGRFKVPEKVAALWDLNARLKKVFARMSDPMTLQCKDQNVTSATMQLWCRDQVGRLAVPCDAIWEKLTKRHADKKCWNAPPPDGFQIDSSLAEVCPLECGWKKGVTGWPPFLTAAEIAAMDKKKKIEEKAKKDEGKDKEADEAAE